MTREEFTYHIDSSNLSVQQKVMWSDVLLMLDDDQLSVFAELVATDSDALQLLTDALEVKKEAFLSGDKDLFSRILATEKTLVE